MDCGSSPLARGLPAVAGFISDSTRIIPARAGFTATGPAVRSGSTDHPRSRGVYPDFIFSKAFLIGSSPLARGLPAGGSANLGVLRIIPARAGFTGGGGLVRSRWPDHPRSRGVYDFADSEDPKSMGSSPLARGLRPSREDCRECGRIIPARAGFTLNFLPLFGWMTDHPRSRGVYLRYGDSQTVHPGSSPLARGLPTPLSLLAMPLRIIPARAGFTLADP